MNKLQKRLKKEIGAVWLKEGAQGKTMEIGGADVMTGVPRVIKLTSIDMIEATNESMEKIIFAIRDVLNHTPPELATDITQNGILLVGGGALLRGIDKRIERDLGLKVKIPKNPLHAVVNGIGKVTANFDYYKESLFDKNFQISIIK